MVFWDASGLAKRYTQESGRETVNAVFAAVPARDMAVMAWGYAETYSILLRKHNGGILDRQTLTAATSALRAAEAEGLPGLNPEEVSPEAVSQLLTQG